MQLLEGLGFGESPRFHDGRLWFCNWGTQEVVAVTPDGVAEVMLTVPTTIPYSIDWLPAPDGRLLVVSGQEAKLLRQEPDGTLATHADLSPFGDVFNELVVDGRGNVYVNGSTIVLVPPSGEAREVARDIRWGNGMAVTPDNGTLIVAESHGNCLTAFDIGADGGLSNRREWAPLGERVPDGACLDAEGAVWVANPAAPECVRVAEGGEVPEVVTTSLPCYACMLGGEDGRTLYMMTSRPATAEESDGKPRGRIETISAPAAHAGRP